MNRRDSLKALSITTLSTGVLVDACKQPDTHIGQTPEKKTASTRGRQQYELKRDHELLSQTFFTPHEMATITVLADIIIPKDEKSGNASDAGVPAFIEFIVKDMPENQLPMRGGLRWLDLQCATRYGKSFVDCNNSQQLEIVTAIAYPAKAAPEMRQGAAFFSLMRDLTASGFFTSEIGIKDLGYAGNSPGIWRGVPEDVLRQYGLQNV